MKNLKSAAFWRSYDIQKCFDLEGKKCYPRTPIVSSAQEPYLP